MAVDSWEPASDADSVSTDPELLARYANLAARDNTRLSDNCDPQAQAHITRLMHLPATMWSDVASGLDSALLRRLIRLFTLAETQLPDCEVAAESPVIPINRELKRRKEPLTRDELLWIRANSNNRFLPNGPL